MIPIGPLVNGAAIIVGALLGLTLHGRFPDRIRTIMFHALGLSVFAIGVKMAMAMTSPILLVVSMLVGAVVGEAIDIERQFARAGDRIKAAAAVPAAAWRYFGFDRKVMLEASAASIGAMPVTSIFGSPVNCPPRRSTSSPIRVPIMPLCFTC